MESIERPLAEALDQLLGISLYRMTLPVFLDN